jgi:hypothetical protein
MEATMSHSDTVPATRRVRRHPVIAALMWLCVALFFGGLFVVSQGYTYAVVVPQERVQVALDAMLPLRTSAGGINFTVHRGATVAFQLDGRIAVSGSFRAHPTLAQTSHFAGTLRATGRLHYDQQRGAFFIRDAALTDGPEGLQGELVLSERVQGALQAGRDVLGRVFQPESPLVEQTRRLLTPESLRAKAPEFLLNRLADVPVYRFANQPLLVRLAGAALTDVTVSEGMLTATLSLNTFLIYVGLLILAGVMAVAITYAIFTSGSAGLLALLALGSCVG